MNKERRKQIGELIAKADSLAQAIAAFREEVESVQSDEQDYYDNIPESLQCGQKGEAADLAIQSLNESMECIESAVSEIESASERLQEIE